MRKWQLRGIIIHLISIIGFIPCSSPPLFRLPSECCVLQCEEGDGRGENRGGEGEGREENRGGEGEGRGENRGGEGKGRGEEREGIGGREGEGKEGEKGKRSSLH